jgi:antitoxin HicB
VTDDAHSSVVIEWSDEDDVFVVSLPEWSRLIHTHGDTYEEALSNGKGLIQELIATRKERGQPLPLPRVFTPA